MATGSNIMKRLLQKEISDVSFRGLERQHHVTPSLIQRLGLEGELEGHLGCVNCLEWNSRGDLLASGSDDQQVILWDPFLYRKIVILKTGHQGNIFSIKFLRSTNDSTIVTGAADCAIRVHDVQSGETTHVYSRHTGRVKRLAVSPSAPYLIWSAAEDGTVMEFDLRVDESVSQSNTNNIIVNLNTSSSTQAEAKCLAVNPANPNQLAVGANDPYVRLYDRRKLSCPAETYHASKETTHGSDEFEMQEGTAKYLVAGHLPAKQSDFKKKYRSLASTYLTFSPDGKELLVNLGGEQIYLFDVNRPRKSKFFDQSCYSSNGIVRSVDACMLPVIAGRNGCTLNIGNIPFNKDVPLHSTVEILKEKASSVFQERNYPFAVSLYNKAISLSPRSAVLYGNRAAAFMKRGWDGDMYAALRDCYSAIQYDKNYVKAYFRLTKCLFGLELNKEAQNSLKCFKSKYPEYAQSKACLFLEKDITAKMQHHEKESSEHDNAEMKENPSFFEGQLNNSSDYELRFCGHCNTTTDIKEANFFGSNGQYIVAGSDDGSFFIWEKSTTNIVRVLRGDESIVNCLQPHPSYCFLATSGIDPVVRLWSPRADDGSKEEREVVNSDDAASANQSRMNADPVEVMLMNMGYRISSVMDRDNRDTEAGGGESPVTCRPS